MDCQSIPVYHDVSGERQVQPLIESLLSVLKTEIDLQKELQRSLEEECRILKRPDSNRLLQSNAKKENILLKAMMLDEVIADIVKKITRTANIREQHVTLSELSAYANPPLQAELQNCRELLASLVMNNREVNQNNRDLLDMLLRLVNNSMRVITNLMSADSDYIGSGQRNTAHMTGAVLCMKG
jgi:flagellar biosynthesis/type III secretory pathway chaperone